MILIPMEKTKEKINIVIIIMKRKTMKKMTQMIAGVTNLISRRFKLS